MEVGMVLPVKDKDPSMSFMSPKHLSLKVHCTHQGIGKCFLSLGMMDDGDEDDYSIKLK